MAGVDWAAWGPAGLFAVFTILILKLFLDYMKAERSAILTNQAHIIENQVHIIEILAKIESAINATTVALIKHESRVTSTMEIMAKSVGWTILEKKAPE